MLDNESALELLQDTQQRYLRLKRVFNQFQEEILLINEPQFPLKGITIENESDEVSRIEFAGFTFEIAFHVISANNQLKGKLHFYQVLRDPRISEISSTTFDENGFVDVDPPEGGLPIILNQDNCSTLLALNLVLIAIY